MNKKIVLLISILVVSVGLLSGCTEEKGILTVSELVKNKEDYDLKEVEVRGVKLTINFTSSTFHNDSINKGQYSEIYGEEYWVKIEANNEYLTEEELNSIPSYKDIVVKGTYIDEDDSDKPAILNVGHEVHGVILVDSYQILD